MVTEVVEIVIRERGSTAASRGIRDVGRSSRTARRAIVALTSAIGVYVGARAIGGVIRSSIDAAAAIEGYTTRLTNLLGSQAEANRAIETFTRLSSRTPFAVGQIVEGASTLAAAALGNRQRLEELTEVASNLAAVTGLSFQEAAGNLQRSLSAGIGAADLFRERGVRAVIESIEGIPDATQLSAAELEQAFRRIFGPGGTFGNAAESLSLTLGGALSNVGDAAFNAQVEIGKILAPSVIAAARTTIIPFFEGLRDIVKENEDEFKAFARDGVEVLARSFGLLVRVAVEAASVLNRLRGIGTPFQAILAEDQLQRAEGRLEGLRRRLSDAIGIGAVNEVAQLREEIASQENVVARLRATVDGLVDEYNAAPDEAAEFEKSLDRLRDLSTRLITAQAGLAESTRNVREEFEKSGGLPGGGGGGGPDTSDAAIAARLGTRPSTLFASGGNLATADPEAAARAQADALAEETEKSDAARAIGQDIGRQTSRALVGALGGDAVDIAGILAGESSKALSGAFENVFGDLATSLQKTFQGALDGVDLGKFSGALQGAIGIGLSLLSGALSGTSQQTSASLVASAVTDSRAVRGVVAGPTSVPIFEVGAELEDALGTTESILGRILVAVEAGAAAITGGSAPVSPATELTTTTESLF